MHEKYMFMDLLLEKMVVFEETAANRLSPGQGSPHISRGEESNHH